MLVQADVLCDVQVCLGETACEYRDRANMGRDLAKVLKKMKALYMLSWILYMTLSAEELENVFTQYKFYCSC